MKLHFATRKDHRCTLCGRRIPRGVNYWADKTGDQREHTNCLEFEDQEVLPASYNQMRPKVKKNGT